MRLGPGTVSTLVFETAQAARLDNFVDDGDQLSVWMAAGLRTAVGAPISVEGSLWGSVVVTSMSEEPLPGDTETRLAGFTELVATAIAFGVGMLLGMLLSGRKR